MLAGLLAKAASFRSTSGYPGGEAGKVISASVCTQDKDNSFRRKIGSKRGEQRIVGQESLCFYFAIPDKEQVVQNVPVYAFFSDLFGCCTVSVASLS